MNINDALAQQGIASWATLSGYAVTESFSPVPTCSTVTGSGALNANGQFTDHITSVCSSSPLTCAQTTTQTLSVAGYPVRTNTLQ